MEVGSDISFEVRRFDSMAHMCYTDNGSLLWKQTCIK